MLTDQIGDMLTRIRNAHGSNHLSTFVSASNAKKSVLKIFENEGYIAGFEEIDDGNNKKSFKIQLRYDKRGGPAIKEIQRVSRPGRRTYVGKTDIPKNKGGLGIFVVSTSKGMLSDTQAREQGLGGELICKVF